VTKSGGQYGFESQDGKWVYYTKNIAGRTAIWRDSAAGGEEIQVNEGPLSYVNNAVLLMVQEPLCVEVAQVTVDVRVTDRDGRVIGGSLEGRPRQFRMASGGWMGAGILMRAPHRPSRSRIPGGG